MRPLLERLRGALETGTPSLPEFERLVIIRGENPSPSLFLDYEAVIKKGLDVPMTRVERLTDTVDHMKVCNLQFTSGTTGLPKATRLTQQ
jgi:long-subunit acyl-CoA synthetase (AMP-forming)